MCWAVVHQINFSSGQAPKDFRGRIYMAQFQERQDELRLTQAMMKGEAEIASEVGAGLLYFDGGWYQDRAVSCHGLYLRHTNNFRTCLTTTERISERAASSYLSCTPAKTPALTWDGLGVLLLKRQMPLSSQGGSLGEVGIIQVSVGTAPETMGTLLSDHSSKCLKEGFRHRVCRVLIMCYHPGH